MSYSPLSHAAPLARQVPPPELAKASMPSIVRPVEAELRSGPVLVLLGERLRTVALGRRLERAGMRILRVSAARLPFLRAESVAGVLLPAREIDHAMVQALAGRAGSDAAWREVPLIVAGPCPEAMWPATAGLGPCLLPDMVESPVSMAALRRILALRLQVMAAREAAERRDETEAALHRRLEQEVLLRREAEHRNKNVLQMACGVLMLEMAGDAGGAAGLSRAAERIRNLSRIQDLLREAADERAVRLDVLLPRLGELITQSTPAHLVVYADVVEAPAEKAVSIGLITAEAVMNALKHARHAGGKVRIRLGVRMMRNGNVLVEITDDGPGMAAAEPADDVRAARRFGGIQIMSMLAERLGGKLLVDCPGGTRVSVSFPLRGTGG